MMIEHAYTWAGTLSPFMLMVVAVILFIIHFLPSFVAFSKNSKNAFLILILNILFGWTGLIWLVLLIWAASE